jgi:hypothetical protein
MELKNMKHEETERVEVYYERIHSWLMVYKYQP